MLGHCDKLVYLQRRMKEAGSFKYLQAISMSKMINTTHTMSKDLTPWRSSGKEGSRQVAFDNAEHERVLISI